MGSKEIITQNDTLKEYKAADNILSFRSAALLSACVDGSLFARTFLMHWRFGRVQSCVRPVNAVFDTAGLDGFRGLGPILLNGLLRPRHLAGYPNPRSDRFAITSHRPHNR